MKTTPGTALALLVVLALLAACSEPKAPPPPPPPAKSDLEFLLEKGRANPRDVETWFHVAEIFDRARQYPQEIDALKMVVAANPPNVGAAHLKLGETYNRLERYPEALASFLEARRLLPKSPALHNNLAWTYGKLGRTEDQIASLREAVSLRPRYATARYNLGLVLLKKGDRAGAAEQLAALLEFDGGSAAALKKEMEAQGK